MDIKKFKTPSATPITAGTMPTPVARALSNPVAPRAMAAGLMKNPKHPLGVTALKRQHMLPTPAKKSEAMAAPLEGPAVCCMAARDEAAAALLAMGSPLAVDALPGVSTPWTPG